MKCVIYVKQANITFHKILSIKMWPFLHTCCKSKSNLRYFCEERKKENLRFFVLKKMLLSQDSVKFYANSMFDI